MSHPCFKSSLTSSNLACASKALDYITGLLIPQQPHHQPLFPKYFAFQPFWHSSRPLTLQSSLSTQAICLSCSFCLDCSSSVYTSSGCVLSSGKSSWVGPNHTLSLCLPHRWLPCIVCELQVSGTGPTLFTDLSPRPSIQLLNEWLNAVPVGHLENSPYLEHDSGL